jgi:hypothetical protein
MATNTMSKADVVTRAEKLIFGATRHPGATPVSLVGSTFTPQEVLAKLQSIVDLRAQVQAAQGALKARLAAEEAAMPGLLAFMSAFTAHVKVARATEADVLIQHGIESKTRTPPTAEQQCLAVEKRAATRKARHTLGTRQKRDIKGEVVGVVITPVTASGPVTPE